MSRSTSPSESLIPAVTHDGTKNQSTELMTRIPLSRRGVVARARALTCDTSERERERKDRRHRGENGWTWNGAERLIEKIYGREEETGGWTRGEKMRRAKKGDGTERTSEKNGREEKIK